MSVDDLYEIKSNPLQRNTRIHAISSNRSPFGHLSEPHQAHANIAIAECDNGTRYLLDGHTRRHLWKSGHLSPPDKLLVILYRVKNKAEACDLYLTFDNVKAVEHKTDQLYGAMRYHGATPPTNFLQNTGVNSCLNHLLFEDRVCVTSRALPMSEIVKPWVRTLQLIGNTPEAFSHHASYPSWVMCAAMLTVCAHGKRSLSFWQAYQDDEGLKLKTSADGIYLSRRHLDHVKAKVAKGMRSARI